MHNICYVSIAGFGNHFVEIGAVAIDIITNHETVLHTLVKPTILDKVQYLIEAKNSHCIPISRASKGLNFANTQKLFKKFLLSLGNNVIIKVHGINADRSSLEILFPKIDFEKYTFQQIPLPKWVHRTGEYHHRAYALKCKSDICHSKNHAMLYSPNWVLNKEPHTGERIMKLLHGYNCALIDAYELAYFDNKL